MDVGVGGWRVVRRVIKPGITLPHTGWVGGGVDGWGCRNKLSQQAASGLMPCTQVCTGVQVGRRDNKAFTF
jgi:hypothetical protein